MAQFIVGNALKGAAAESNWLRRLLWRIDFVIVSALLFLFRRLPLDRASALGRRFGAWLGPRLEKNRHLLRNLEIAFPGLAEAERRQLSREVWAQGGAVFAEYTQLDRLCRDRHGDRIEVVVAEEIEAFQQAGVPAIFVTAHLANWELVGAAATRMGIPLTCLYSPPTNPLLATRLVHERSKLGIGLLPRDGSTRALIQTLQSGCSLGVVMDRRVDNGHPIPFFGVDKSTTLVPARLALKHGCQLVPVQVERLPDTRFRITFHPPVVARDPRATVSEQAIDMTRQVNGLFEDWIRRAPASWLCTKRLWSKNLAAQDAAGDPDTNEADYSLRQANS